MKKNKKKPNITLIVTLGVLLMAGLYFGVTLYKDKQKFTDASKGISKIGDSLHPNNGDSYEEYCMYGRQKYSKGTLSCYVNYSFKVKESAKHTIDTYEEKIKEMSWKKKGTNTDYFKKNDQSYISANIFTNGTLSCHSRYKLYNQDTLIVEIGCSGPARAEWFPVREN